MLWESLELFVAKSATVERPFVVVQYNDELKPVSGGDPFTPFSNALNNQADGSF